MKLYAITVYDGVSDTRSGHWYGTQADWKVGLKKFKSEDYEIVNSEPVEVPTDKAGLLKFLNDNEVQP